MSVTAAFFLFVFCIGTILALARGPFFGLLLYVYVFYASPADRWWAAGFVADTRWSLVAAGVALAAVLLHPQQLNKERFWSRVPIIVFILFVLWLGLQMLWALNIELQQEIFSYYSKFIVTLFLVFRTIRTEKQLKTFLIAHLLGCVYFGWIAYTNYKGGRFEGFGGPGLSDANSAAIAFATAVITGLGLFLAASAWRQRAVVIAAMPLILNGLAATMSRGATLALMSGGFVFHLLSPKVSKRQLWVISIAGLLAFVSLTDKTFWERLGTVKYLGANVEGIDTGGARSNLLPMQWKIFKENPFGCGYRCTNLLSSNYLDEKDLSQLGDRMGRSSHNTFMSLLVEHGMIGAAVYIALLAWILFSGFRFRKEKDSSGSGTAALRVLVVSALFAICVGDMFSDFLKFEIRIWFIALLVLLTGSKGPNSQGGAHSLGQP